MSEIFYNLKSLGFEPENILDIGAHHGLWTKEVLQVYPNAKYTLIEPINYRELKFFSENYSNINVYNELLFNIETEIDWYEMKNTGDSIYKERTNHFTKCVPIKKYTKILDNLLDNNIKYDLIKLDVQGAEIDVLKGGNKIIKNTSFIILELPFMGQYNENTPTFLEHIQYMNEIGFIPFDIIDLHKIDSLLFQIDICFINKNHNINQIMQNKICDMGK
jgi:FkbM family methyltransferase